MRLALAEIEIGREFPGCGTHNQIYVSRARRRDFRQAHTFSEEEVSRLLFMWGLTECGI